ncbi:MAG: site-specific integrase [Actinomycetota bacterium]|nr:site-specific integrase [Actinomycetota bacterium]
MRGHVYKRGETWTAVFDVGEQPRTRCASCDWKRWGVSARSRCPECREPVEVPRERRQRSKGGFPSKAAAEDHLALRLAEIARGAHVMPNDITVGEYLSRWLEVQRSQLEPTTWVNYRRRIARYFEPALGGIPLQALRVQHLNALYAEIKERGGAKGQPLSVATVRRLHAVLHKALNDAAKQDLVAYNVASKATLPKRDIHLDEPNDKRFKAWNADELRAFLALIEGHPLESAFVLAANTGMRRGELAGLIWEDVDLDGRQLYVRHALGYVNKRAYLKAPKTNRPRTISIDAGTVAVLRARRRAQAVDKLAWPGEWANEWGLVFTREDGRWINPMQYTDKFRKLVEASDLPRITLHDLRHTHATLMLQAGVPVKVVADRLGHADISMTLNTYAHVLPAMDEQAVATFVQHVYRDRDVH